MNDAAMLTAMKTDLGITTDTYDTRLGQYITSAKKAIEIEGITLTDDVADSNLVVMYAAWLWRKRATGEGIPRSLRWAMNNRLFAEKLTGGTD